ncbi:MAG: nucleotide pyrophosphohydrolase [Desulfurococcales archaeon]|nr:nucleotide pyrophosphohydrolase [Desulfurococcales archaeon]
MSIECIQEAMKKAFYERDSRRGLFKTFSWLVEEVGELAEALLKGDSKSIEEEIADVIAWTLSIANLTGVDASRALMRKYSSEINEVECFKSS